ncbi:MAG: hypothetical protein ACRDBI_04120, partial [Shewanella sp.]
KTEIAGGKLTIHQEGKYPKFVKSVDEISASGDFRAEQGGITIYVTERCVFERNRDGMMLIEIAPGIDMQRDILDRLPFKPIISPALKEMDARFFSEIVE